MKRKLAAWILITLMIGTAATSCGKKEPSPDSTESAAEESELSSEDLEAESETVIEESVSLDKIKTAYNEAEETDPDAAYELDEASATVREDGSVVVQATDEKGNAVVLIYEDEASYKSGESAVLAPVKEIAETVTEAAATTAKTAEGTSGNKENTSASAGGSKDSVSSNGGNVSNSSGNGNNNSGSSTGNTGSGNGNTGTSAAPTTAATAAPTSAAATEAPTTVAPQTEAPTTAAPTKSQEEILLEEYNSISTDQIKAWFLQGYNAKRAALGLSTVPEDATLNAQCQAHAERCAANTFMHSSGYGIYYDNVQYESMSPCGRYMVSEPDGSYCSNVETYDGNAYYFGADGGWAHCPQLYTADTQAIGIGVARRPGSQDFIIVVQGYDYGWND